MRKKGKPASGNWREKVAKIGKMVTAVLLTLIMLLSMGMVWVKDSRQQPSYCAGCHEDPYYTSWESDGDSYSLAHQHATLSVSCQTCHDRTMSESLGEIVNYVTGNYYYPFDETELSMDTCFACHESYEKVITLTRTDITGAERNYHAGHWGELECGECHNMHRASTNYCSDCHEPVEEPGWE